MKDNERNEDMLKNENVEKTMNVGNSVPNIHPVEGQEVEEGMDPTNEVAGVKPRASGRQGGISAQDGGQDVGSSSGSH